MPRILPPLTLLRRFQKNAGVQRRRTVAERYWPSLRRQLTDAERDLLRAAWSRVLRGEGRADIDSVCEQIRARLQA